ncbi:hypothetical protein Tco_1123879 [Tanacetum coccineum]|uniref:Uncharacterized protein n=1 Tax=Tanacetum coccineum TaxID=301880 RepID=A0ABQ5J4M8_9ASTR
MSSISYMHVILYLESPTFTLKTLRPSLKPGRAHICTINIIEWRLVRVFRLLLGNPIFKVSLIFFFLIVVATAVCFYCYSWLWVLRDGKVVLGKDGKPMKASRRVQFDANKGDILLDYPDSVTNISHAVDDICEGSSKADDLVHTATEDESSENYEKGQAG